MNGKKTEIKIVTRYWIKTVNCKMSLRRVCSKTSSVNSCPGTENVLIENMVQWTTSLAKIILITMLKLKGLCGAACDHTWDETSE